MAHGCIHIRINCCYHIIMWTWVAFTPVELLLHHFFKWYKMYNIHIIYNTVKRNISVQGYLCTIPFFVREIFVQKTHVRK